MLVLCFVHPNFFFLSVLFFSFICIMQAIRDSTHMGAYYRSIQMSNGCFFILSIGIREKKLYIYIFFSRRFFFIIIIQLSQIFFFFSSFRQMRPDRSSVQYAKHTQPHRLVCGPSFFFSLQTQLICSVHFAGASNPISYSGRRKKPPGYPWSGVTAATTSFFFFTSSTDQRLRNFTPLLDR